jgi:CRISPR-associated protein Cas2
MTYCVAYDITSDKVRRQVVKLCKQTGLMRVQKSIFIGSTDNTRISELEKGVASLIHALTDRFFIAPMDNLAFQQLRFLGFQPDKEMLSHQAAVIFF